jgi:hypothetical protein
MVLIFNKESLSPYARSNVNLENHIRLINGNEGSIRYYSLCPFLPSILGLVKVKLDKV